MKEIFEVVGFWNTVLFVVFVLYLVGMSAYTFWTAKKESKNYRR
jgi:cbb3-type cytochrome oxidase subunit 3